jgi:hypothetical protein
MKIIAKISATPFWLDRFMVSFSLQSSYGNNAVTEAGMGCERRGSTRLAVSYTSTTFRGATFNNALVSG